MTFLIPRKLPSLNEYINACRRNAYAGATFKKNVENKIIDDIRVAVNDNSVRPIGEKTVILNIDFYEKTKKRDADNIQSATKYILDAMQKAGILINDSRKYVKQIYHNIYDSDRDFVIVHIYDEQKENNKENGDKNEKNDKSETKKSS